MMNNKKTRKWLFLSAAATALLLIPRRSSRKTGMKTDNSHNIESESSHTNRDHMDESSK